MNIVMITTNDPAGAAINFTKALNRSTEHRCRLITTEIRYNFMFDKDIHIPWVRDFSEVRHVLETADVIHFHMTADESMSLGPLAVDDYVRGRKVVHHHHGEPPFRANPEPFRTRERKLGRKAIVSTPDLLKLYPEATWIPNPVPLNEPDYLPLRSEDRDSLFRVGHSPTRKELKNTLEFLEVSGSLGGRHERFRSVMIEQRPHRDCLKIKKTCNLFFDHMQGYYGLSSLEALSQGLPTIAGLDDWNTHHLHEFTGSSRLPWITARNAEELEGRIEDLMFDDHERHAQGRYSREWMEQHWPEERLARALVEVYQTA